MQSDMNDIKFLKEDLLKRRMTLAAKRKSPDWTMKNLNVVLKN